MNIGGGTSPENSGEKKALEYVYSKLTDTKNIVLFDVGANIGLYSNLIAEVFGTRAKICSFEPSKKSFDKMVLNTKLFSNISCYNFGFGDEQGKAVLFSDAEASVLASLYQRRIDHHNICMDKSEEIEMCTIDEFCVKNDINRVHFLKLDVEGHEMKVLEGASKILASGAVDYVQFEFGGCNIDSKTYFQDFFYFFKDNYNIYRIINDGLYKIDKYHERHEVFTTTNYLVEKIHQ